MIDIRLDANVENEAHYQLFIDGRLIEDATITRYITARGDSYDITLRDSESVAMLTAYRLADIPAITEITLNYQLAWLDVLGTIWVIYSAEDGSYELWFQLNRISRWQGAVVFADFYKELSRLIRESEHSHITMVPSNIDHQSVTENFSVIFFGCSPEVTIASEITKSAELLHDFYDEAQRNISARVRAGSVVMSFDFPEEVRVPCEQYLLYFADFLKGLGVEATADIQHEAGQVLFAVTPTNKEEALDNIREALSDYLKLAASPVNPASVLSSEIEVQRLAANIQHLQGQLTLAHAVLQAKDATIQLQQATINQQHRMLGGEIIVESLKDVTPKPKSEDSDEMLGGTVAITPLKGEGFEVDLPGSYRRIKRRFNREE